MSGQLPLSSFRLYIEQVKFDASVEEVRPGADIPAHNIVRSFEKGCFIAANEKGRTPIVQAQYRELIPVEFHMPPGAAGLIEKGNYSFTLNREFDRVMLECTKPRKDGDAKRWIDQNLALKYSEVHQARDAHSLEIYKNGRLVGGHIGLQRYGNYISLASFGEEMVAYVTLQSVLCKAGAVVHDAIRPSRLSRQLGGVLVLLQDHLKIEASAKQKRLVLPVTEDKLPVAQYIQPLING